MHMSTDLCTQGVNDLVQGLGAGGVHTDEELIMVFINLRRTGFDVRQVDSLTLWFTETKRKKRRGWDLSWYLFEFQRACVLSLLDSTYCIIYIICCKRFTIKTKWNLFAATSCSTACISPPEGVVLLNWGPFIRFCLPNDLRTKLPWTLFLQTDTEPDRVDSHSEGIQDILWWFGANMPAFLVLQHKHPKSFLMSNDML